MSRRPLAVSGLGELLGGATGVQAGSGRHLSNGEGHSAVILRQRTILKMGAYFPHDGPNFSFRGIFLSSKLIVVVVALSIFKGVILASSASTGRLAVIMLHPRRNFWPHRTC